MSFLQMKTAGVPCSFADENTSSTCKSLLLKTRNLLYLQTAVWGSQKECMYLCVFQGREWNKKVDQDLKDDSHGFLGAVNS